MELLSDSDTPRQLRPILPSAPGKTAVESRGQAQSGSCRVPFSLSIDVADLKQSPRPRVIPIHREFRISRGRATKSVATGVGRWWKSIGHVPDVIIALLLSLESLCHRYHCATKTTEDARSSRLSGQHWRTSSRKRLSPRLATSRNESGFSSCSLRREKEETGLSTLTRRRCLMRTAFDRDFDGDTTSC